MSVKRNNLGKWGEQKAKEHLIKLGYELVAENWRNRLGEIDLIMWDGEILVFIEVRTKNSTTYGSGLESITLKKQQQLQKMANSFLIYKRWADIPIRFDVISIDKRNNIFQLQHFKNVLY